MLSFPLRAAATSIALVFLAATAFVALSPEDGVTAGAVPELSESGEEHAAIQTAMLAPEPSHETRLARSGAGDALAIAAWSNPANARTREALLRGAVQALRGRIVERGGAPIPRAEIRVILEGGEVRFDADAAGCFSLDLPLAPQIALEARASGYLPACFAALPFEGELDLALDPMLGLRGRAIDASSGGAIAGVELVAARLAAASGVPYESAPVRTNAEGHFEIGGLGPGDFELRATAGGFAPARLERVALRRGQDEEVSIALRPALHLVVRVVDGDGSALPACGVRVQQEADGGRPRVDLSATTDARGEARFTGLAPGPADIVARCSERAAEHRQLELTDKDETARTVEIRLSRGLYLQGVVRAPSGLPAVRAHVVLLDAKRRVPRFASPEEEELAVRTDESGSFRIGGLRPGTWRICAFDAELAFASRELQLDAQKRPPEALEIALLPPFGVRGRILDPAGAPVPDVEIELGPEGARDALGDRRYARSDAAGTFEIGPFPRVPIELRAVAAGFREEREVVAPPKQSATAEITLLLRGAHGVRGQIRDTLGRAVGPVRVELREELSSTAERRKPHVFRGRSDEFGSFFVADVLAGVYAVRVESFGHDPRPIDRAQIALPGDEVVALTLELLERAPTGTVLGLVRSTTTGDPPRSFQVEGVGLQGGSVSYGADGRFQWSGIEAGIGGIEVKAPRHARRYFSEVEVWGGGRLDLGVVELPLGADLEVGTRLHALQRDEGKKQNVEQKLRLELRPLDPEVQQRGARTLEIVGKEGRANIESLMPGTWEIVVRAQSGWTGKRKIVLGEGVHRTSIELLSPAEQTRRRDVERAAERNQKRAELERARRAAAEAARKR